MMAAAEDLARLCSGDEVARDAEDDDAGQHQQRRRTGDAAQQAIAREMTVQMTVHGLSPPMPSLKLSAANGEGSVALAEMGSRFNRLHEGCPAPNTKVDHAKNY